MAGLRAVTEMQANGNAQKQRINHRPAFEQLMDRAGRRGFLSSLDRSGAPQRLIGIMKPLLVTAKAKGVEKETLEAMKSFSEVKDNKIVLLFLRRLDNLVATSDPKDIPKLLDHTKQIMKQFPERADTAPQMVMNFRSTLGARAYEKLSGKEVVKMMRRTVRLSPGGCPDVMTKTAKTLIARGEFSDIQAITAYKQHTANTFELPPPSKQDAQAKPYMIADVNSQDS